METPTFNGWCNFGLRDDRGDPSNGGNGCKTKRWVRCGGVDFRSVFVSVQQTAESTEDTLAFNVLCIPNASINTTESSQTVLYNEEKNTPLCTAFIFPQELLSLPPPPIKKTT